MKLIKFSGIFQNELEFSSERITNQWSHVHLLHHERVLHWVGAFKHSTTLCISMMHKLTGEQWIYRDFLSVFVFVESSCDDETMEKRKWKLFSPLMAHISAIRFKIHRAWWISSLEHLHVSIGFNAMHESRYSPFVNLCRKQSRAQWNRVISSYQKQCCMLKRKEEKVDQDKCLGRCD